MNALEARRILQAYRPGTADEQDPQVSQALALASRDPELAAWLASHQAFQKAMREKLRSMPVPADLKARLLAGVKEQQKLREAPLLKSMDLSKPRWRKSMAWSALTLAIVLLAGFLITTQIPRVPDRFTNFQNRMVSTALRQYRMDVLTPDMGQLRDYLAKAGGPSDYKIPAGLQKFQLTGGGLLKWRNNPVSMVCFERPDKQMLFLFVTDRSAMKDPPGEQPRTETVNELRTVSWREGDRVYVLAGPNDAGVSEGLL